MTAPTDKLVIRPMSSHDVTAVAALEQEIYPQPWAARVFHDELGLANRDYIVAAEGDAVVGYAGLLLRRGGCPRDDTRRGSRASGAAASVPA